MTEETSSYFRVDDDALPDPNTAPQHVRMDDTADFPLAPGVRARPVFGTNLLVNHVYFDPHAEAPLHKHPEEQAGTVLQGELEFEIGGETIRVRPGEVYVIPPNVLHAARTHDAPAVALDIFSPPRSGFRELWEQAQGAD